MARVMVAGTASVVLAAAVAIAAWWFLVRDTAQLATSAPEIPGALLNATATPSAQATDTATAAEASTASTLTFEVDSGLSEAAYFVNEELATVGIPSTAKGTTNQVSARYM